MTRTKTLTFAKVPNTELEIELIYNTEEPESSMLFHVEDKRVIVAYLVHDSHCENPLENSDGNGMIYSARKHTSGNEIKRYREALGLNDDFFPDYELLSEHELVESAHKKIIADPDLFQLAFEHAEDNYSQNEDESKEAFVRRVSDTAEYLEIDLGIDLDEVKLELWRKFRAEGTIGNKYAIPLDVYEHSQICYSLPGEGMQDRFDTSRGGAVWVPDECAIENFEDKTLSHAENLEKAMGYARSCVEMYTNWCNGDTWGLVVQSYDTESKESEYLESCWGYIGQKYALKDLEVMFKRALKAGI